MALQKDGEKVVHTTLPGSGHFIDQGVTDALGLLKISGLGAQLIVKGIKDPEGTKQQGRDLLQKIKEEGPKKLLLQKLIEQKKAMNL